MRMTIVLALLLSCGSALAQTSLEPISTDRIQLAEKEAMVSRGYLCVRYSSVDRGSVKGVLLKATRVLNRMTELAYLSSIPQPLVQLNLTQRIALNNEYLALVNIIDRLGQEAPKGLQPRTVQLLQNILNSKFLFLAGTKITGTSDAEALDNAQVAHSAVSNAAETIWKCE